MNEVKNILLREFSLNLKGVKSDGKKKKNHAKYIHRYKLAFRSTMHSIRGTKGYTKKTAKEIEFIISITTSNFAYVKRKHLCILLCLLEYTACAARSFFIAEIRTRKRARERERRKPAKKRT